jgi:hypothetical protein
VIRSAIRSLAPIRPVLLGSELFPKLTIPPISYETLRNLSRELGAAMVLDKNTDATPVTPSRQIRDMHITLAPHLVSHERV